MNPVAALALLFFRHLQCTPPPRMPVHNPASWRRRMGARRARGFRRPAAPWLFGPSRCEKECRAASGKTMRHRISGQVRSVVVWDHCVQFAQDSRGCPRLFDRSFRSAAK